MSKEIQTQSVGGSMVPGRKPSNHGNDSLCRLVFYTGTAQDKLNYGVHEDGTFLDEMDKTVFGKRVNVCVVGAVSATYSKWIKGQAAPVYFFGSWDEVPQNYRRDFEWGGPDGKVPPEGTETISVLLLLLNDKFMPVAPYLFRFKRTSLPAWDGKQGMEKHETTAAARDPEGFGACIFELSSETAKNASNQPYARLTSRMVQRVLTGNPLREPLKEFRSRFGSLRQQAQAIREDGEGDAAGAEAEASEAHTPITREDIPF